MQPLNDQPVTVSAPGKLFILGEHAVVYDGTCIVTAVDSRLRMTLQASTGSANPQLTITAPDVGLDGYTIPLYSVLAKQRFEGPSAFIESCVAVFHRQFTFQSGIQIETSSDFGATLGLGSSSATVAATLFGLATCFGISLSPGTLFQLGLEAIRQVQRLGSGADLAAAVYGGIVFYRNREPRQVTTLETDQLPLLVIYSGAKAGTVSYVQQVRALHERWPEPVDSIIQAMLQIVAAGWQALLAGDYPALGQLMNMQHGLLHALGVDTPALASIVFAARQLGALGAKLSGAGGGDCAIALVAPSQYAAMKEALQAEGRHVLDIQVNAPGVRRD